MTAADRFHIIDTRTGRPASWNTYLSRESCERQIASWRERDAKGQRADIHDLMPFLGVADGPPADQLATVMDIIREDRQQWPEGHPCRYCDKLYREHPNDECEAWR